MANYKTNKNGDYIYLYLKNEAIYNDEYKSNKKKWQKGTLNARQDFREN